MGDFSRWGSAPGQGLPAEGADLPGILDARPCPGSFPRLELSASWVVGAVRAWVLLREQRYPEIGAWAEIEKLAVRIDSLFVSAGSRNTKV